MCLFLVILLDLSVLEKKVITYFSLYDLADIIFGYKQNNEVMLHDIINSDLILVEKDSLDWLACIFIRYCALLLLYIICSNYLYS